MTVVKLAKTPKGYFTPVLGKKLGDTPGDESFKLDEKFLAKYAGKKPNFGYGGLGEFTFYRTYSRTKEDGTKESALDTFCRVVEGCYEIQRRYCDANHIPWSQRKAQKSAQEMFDRMWQFKFLPPGRGLWAMGTPFMWERGSAALNNCAFCSTTELNKEPAEPFCFMMDMSMLGVGVGFDTRGAGKVAVVKPHKLTDHSTHDIVFEVPDSREGWVKSLEILIQSYTSNPELGRIKFNYDLIRPEGSTINGFGGKASGPSILIELHHAFTAHFKKVLRRTDTTLDSVDIVDLMNYIGRCVVAGNVRRTAQLSLGDVTDMDYVTMKNPRSEVGPVIGRLINTSRDNFLKEGIEPNARVIKLDLAALLPEPPSEAEIQRYLDTEAALLNHRWASNNSMFATSGMDYTPFLESIATNGEPGFVWMDAIRNFGRTKDGPKPGCDRRAVGTNPCAEQSLENYELCCLCEMFPSLHDSVEDYHRTVKFAYLYAKTVTLLPTHNKRTNAVMMRNKRIGLSNSGITQAFEKFGRRTVLSEFFDKGYKLVEKWDDVYSDWLCCSRSIKKTSVKPSGTVSLLPGVFPGIHYSVAPSKYYWRRVRISADSKLVEVLTNAGYDIEPAVTDPRTLVVKFAVADPYGKTIAEATIWEQVKNAVDMQRYWADNQVSVTIQFKPEEAEEIPKVLEAFDDELKSISFLPTSNHGYAQPPYEASTKEEVEAYNAKISPMDFTAYLFEDGTGTKFCDSDKCVLQ